jgi:isocitrate dehydrogenase (NAD+)
VQSAAEKMIPATLIAGDGIGPKIVEATLIVLDALGAPFAWEVHKAGIAGLEAFGDPLPQTTLDSIRRTRLALKGPLTTPVGGGYRSSNVRLREVFQLYANVRPARTLVPGGRYEDVDVVLVRENLEGLCPETVRLLLEFCSPMEAALRNTTLPNGIVLSAL